MSRRFTNPHTHRHLVPAVIIDISDDKSRQYEKEVYGKIAVVDGLVSPSVIVSFKQVVAHDQHGSHSAQAVQYFIAGLGGKIDVVFHIAVVACRLITRQCAAGKKTAGPLVRTGCSDYVSARKIIQLFLRSSPLRPYVCMSRNVSWPSFRKRRTRRQLLSDTVSLQKRSELHLSGNPGS